MNKKYSDTRYDEFGLFIIKDRWSDGYKIICDEDGWISDITYKNTKLAQDFINRMIHMMDNSKVKWYGI